MLLGTLGARLLGSILAREEIVRERKNKQENGIVIDGYETKKF